MFGELIPTAAINFMAATSGNWTVDSFLENGAKVLNHWGALIILILGVAALIVAAYQIVTGLISHGKKQTSWAVVIILIVIGGIFVAAGVGGIAGGTFGDLAKGVGQSVNDIGSGKASGKADGIDGLSTILPMLHLL